MGWSQMREVFRVTRFRSDLRSDVDEELAFHFGEVERALVEQGMSPSGARREARRRFGNVTRYRTELEAMGRGAIGRRIRDRIVEGADTAFFAVRAIVRSPGVGIAVVATLALGLGANVAMFRVVDRLLLSPPEHVRDADRVRLLYAELHTPEGTQTRESGSFPDFQDLRGVRGFESVAAYTSRELVVGEGADAELMRVKIGSGDFFALLGVDAALGRTFAPEDDRLDAEPTTVLSWTLWDRAYGRDPGVLGQTLRVGNGRYTVVGVAPRGFTGVNRAPVDLWLPLEHFASNEEGWPWRESRYFSWIRVVARIAPGISEQAALDEATAAFRGVAGDEPSARAEAVIAASSLVPADRPEAGGEITVAGWLGGVSLIVLLLACANVANLLLTRNLRRRRELAVRAALGIGRRRLIGQLMAEVGILAVVGGLAGLALAVALGGPLYAVLLPDLALPDSVLDGRILTFSAVAVALAVFLAGTLPAILSSGQDLLASLQSSGERTGVRRTRTQVGLLILQVTLSVVLLTGASVYVRSLTNLRAIDLGFETDGLALVSLDVDGAQGGFALLDEPEDGPAWPPNEWARISELAQRRLAAAPGVHGAALVHPTPFLFALSIPLHVPGLDSIPGGPGQGPVPVAVSPEYFDVMDLELVAGRGFSPDDDRFGAQPVTVLSEAMAVALWPGEEALGRCIMPGGEDHPCATVVGIVEDSHRQAIIEDEPGMIYYLPIRQQILGGAPENIFVRTAGADLSSIRSAAQSASAEVRYARVQPFSEITGWELRPWRLGATVLSAFGLLALVVAAFGLYAVVAFDVAGRSRELGIRSALGASRGGLFGLIVRDVGLLGGAGIALGFLAIVGLRRWLDPLLYETSATEVATLLPVGGLLLAVAVLAAAVPGSRAARADPVEALRAD